MSETEAYSASIFLTDRGERAYYTKAAETPKDPCILPITRDGYEALMEVAAKQFDPPLPVNDSMRSVVSGFVHHIANDINSTSVMAVAATMYKSVSNALTWTIDQEVKKKRQDEIEKLKLQMKADEDEARRKAALEKAVEKRAQKQGKKYSVKGKTLKEKEAE
jgi:hypothetical protein